MTALDEAIANAGSVSALSKAMGFPYPSTVSNWRQSGRVPEDQAPAIERITGVRCERLCPDVDWVRDSAGNPTGYLVKVGAADAHAA